VIALLDVDVLVALFDPEHLHHERAHAWFAENRSSGWATCPLTENGFARAVAHPDYPGRRSTVADALERLQSFTESGDHHFWPDSTSLRRRSRLAPDRLEGHERITPVYLLLLAVENGGRLATFETGIPIAAVLRARPEQIVVLGERLA
jgi:toxin-antitoxin system PIN domain toxin